MIAASGIPFIPVLIAAAIGAALGDWISYSIGYHFKDRIAHVWPLSSHPDLLPRGHAFMDKWGVLGIFINRKNVIVILMSIELILLSVNINLVAFSSYGGNLIGQVFALLILTVAAAEAAIGLAILVVFYRNRGSIAVEDINTMKG